MGRRTEKSAEIHPRQFCWISVEIYYLKMFLADGSNLFIVNSRSDGVGTVTQEEKEKFSEIKERLRVQLEYQLTNFRSFQRCIISS